MHRNDLPFTITLDGTTFVLSVDTAQHDHKAAKLTLSGNDVLRRGQAVYDFMTRWLDGNGYEVKAWNHVLAGLRDELTFMPRRDELLPGNRSIRISDDPHAAAQEIMECLQEMKRLSDAHHARMGRSLPFEDIIARMNERHPAPPQERVPAVVDIRRRTAHNVPLAELRRAVTLGIATSNVEDYLPGGMRELEKLSKRTLAHLQKSAIFTRSATILGTRAETTDHQVRMAVRTALKAALTELQATEPARAEDEVMANFIQEMHKAKRRNPPFSGRG